MNNALLALTTVTCLGTALMAGVFFAFSALVMKAFGRLSPSSGLAAMQAVNASAVAPLFLFVLLGTGLAAAVLGVVAVVSRDQAYAGWLLAGSAAYLVGAIGVTIGYHVPRNEALATLTPASDGASRLWAEYLSRWTAWNHLRTLAALAATASLLAAVAVG